MKTLTALIICFITLLNINIFGVVSGNWSCSPLIPGGCQNSNIPSGLNSVKDGTTIGQIIAEGTYYFTKANSKYQEFLSMIEISEHRGYNFLELKTTIKTALQYMDKSKQMYIIAFEIASQCDYDVNYLHQLKQFDFDDFQQKNSLIPSIFKITMEFLSKGNIKGIFKKFATDSLNVTNLLINIKFQVDSEKVPDYDLIWKCNQSFYETHLFGQYVSMVFYNLL